MKQRQHTKMNWDLAFLWLVCGFFVLAALWTALRPKASWSYFENRSLTPRPVLTRETVVDGTYFQELEKHLCDNAAGRKYALGLSTWIDLELVRRPVVNEVVVEPDMLLAYNGYEKLDEQAMADCAAQEAERLGRLARLTESWGGTFLYVAVPSHYAYFAQRYPGWLNNREAYTALSKELFFSALDSQNVPWLDVGEVWSRDGAPTDYMSATDHHWTLAGCLSAYREILRALESRTGQGLEALTGENARTVTLPNSFLGSRGRKLLGLWDTGERLSYLEPLESVPFTRRDNGQEAAPSVFSFPASDSETLQYGFYMGGDIPETVISTDRPQLPSLLIYGDSYTNLLETLMYYSFDTTYSIDLRGYTEMPLLSYVEAHRPRVVVCVRDYEQLLNLSGNGNID